MPRSLLELPDRLEASRSVKDTESMSFLVGLSGPQADPCSRKRYCRRLETYVAEWFSVTSVSPMTSLSTAGSACRWYRHRRRRPHHGARAREAWLSRRLIGSE